MMAAPPGPLSYTSAMRDVASTAPVGGMGLCITNSWRPCRAVTKSTSTPGIFSIGGDMSRSVGMTTANVGRTTRSRFVDILQRESDAPSARW
jgi:hypothetical protein